jgi:hypothetical protein
VLAQIIESCTFVAPGPCIIGIEPDSLIVSLDGFIEIALVLEGIAFVVPGNGIVGVKPNSLI